jgi:hypothetical protein
MEYSSNQSPDIDPFICPRCQKATKHLGCGWYWCRSPGCRTVYKTKPLPQGVIATPLAGGPDDPPYTFLTVFTPHYIEDYPPTPEPKPGPRANECERESNLRPSGVGVGGASASVRLTDRQELILKAITDLAGSNAGPWRGRKIAEQARLDYDSRIRTELSMLSKLGFLKNDGAGYARTDKPYPGP